MHTHIHFILLKCIAIFHFPGFDSYFLTIASLHHSTTKSKHSFSQLLLLLYAYMHMSLSCRTFFFHFFFMLFNILFFRYKILCILQTTLFLRPYNVCAYTMHIHCDFILWDWNVKGELLKKKYTEKKRVEDEENEKNIK